MDSGSAGLSAGRTAAAGRKYEDGGGRFFLFNYRW